MKVTSRERPYKLRECVEAYLKKAKRPDLMIWSFSFDEDDYEINKSKYESIFSILFGPNQVYSTAKERSNKIGAINTGVIDDDWDILLNISDDQLPIVYGYDEIIRKEMPEDLDYSLWFNDGWQNRINTQEIVGRNYYERFGYIYHPEYKSFFCDNEATMVAQKLNRMKKINKCIIKHFHPGHMKNCPNNYDDLYRRNDAYWEHDQNLFNQRLKANFYL